MTFCDHGHSAELRPEESTSEVRPGPIPHALPAPRGRYNGHNGDKPGEAFSVRGRWDIPRSNGPEESREHVSCCGGTSNDDVSDLA